MLRYNQRVRIGSNLTYRAEHKELAMRIRGTCATVRSRVIDKDGYYRLHEYDGVMFHERHLFPIDDDENDDDDRAFKRFMSKVDLTPLNPWMEKA